MNALRDDEETRVHMSPAAIVLAMLGVGALPIWLTLRTVTASDADVTTPLGYTWSLSLWITPVLALLPWWLRQLVGIYVDAWGGVPIEEPFLWLLCPFTTIPVYHALRQRSWRRARGGYGRSRRRTFRSFP